MTQAAEQGQGYVVTGGGRGVGRAIVELLVGRGGTVAMIERDHAALDWIPQHPHSARLVPVLGDPGDDAVAGRAVDQLRTAPDLPDG